MIEHYLFPGVRCVLRLNQELAIKGIQLFAVLFYWLYIMWRDTR